MDSGPGDQKAEKSYLSSAVESINPWLGGKVTATGSTSETDPPGLKAAPAPSATPDDHSTTHLYGRSSRSYPLDCPPLTVQWFHAVDVPKRKPQFHVARGQKSSASNTKPPIQPKKFSAFSLSDSKAIEAGYQKILEATEDRQAQSSDDGKIGSSRPTNAPSTSLGIKEGASADQDDLRIPVNEDFLFDVDIKRRELAPAYWLGPIYEVRRGTWFFQEGSSVRPCEENLAAQLEEGYLKLKPWLHLVIPNPRSTTGSQSVTPKPSAGGIGKGNEERNPSGLQGTQRSSGKARPSESSSQQPVQPQSYRLFGAYMNSVATYQDRSTAWLSSDSMFSWVTSSVYEKFAGGGYMGGIKLVRGYTETSKPKEKDEKTPAVLPSSSSVLDEHQQKLLKRRSAPPSTRSSETQESHDGSKANTARPAELRLQRQLSSLLEGGGKSSDETEEEVRKMEEEEIQDDYNAQAGETQGREIEHLVLVTHGIGQLLSLRMESVNFVHDVNVMRKTFKSVYTDSEDLRALNSEVGAGPGNCRVQVLPVCWRHMLDFPKQRGKAREHDLGDTDTEEDNYPSLDDITIEGIAFARSLISDLALDVLLYQSSYREEIAKIVLGECNRIFRLFKERNPEFKGKVHLIGHSLGSAILFDILCQQRENASSEGGKNPLRFWPAQARQDNKSKDRHSSFEFEVEDFYCLGSPIGLFQMLKGRTISARSSRHSLPSDVTIRDGSHLATSMTSDVDEISPVSGLPVSVSSPKVEQLFNIFHPSDPISYRLEPLISPAMTVLKPQALPYTKKGIFGAVAPQGLSGIGVKVGQSVSGLWSSFSAGIANNLLNRSLGLTSEDVARLAAETHSGQQVVSPGAGTNISSGGVISDAMGLSEKLEGRNKQPADSSANLAGSHEKDTPLTEKSMETLYSNFQKKRNDGADGAGTDKSTYNDGKARRMRIEESKVRALNRSGRVDFSIQEGALDFNPINTIASHMCYWADEDVNHFILSQLLSRQSNGARNR